MTTASKITMVRVAMIPMYMAAMYMSHGQAGMWMYISLGIFIIASLTDFVDGYIARHYNQTTDFGKFLDPLADKLLTIAAMAMFCEWKIFPAWALMIVLTREFAVTGLRLVAVEQGRVIAAGMSGKIKTVLQMIAVPLLLLLSVFPDLPVLYYAAYGFLWASLVMTVVSGTEYIWKNKNVFSM